MNTRPIQAPLGAPPAPPVGAADIPSIQAALDRLVGGPVRPHSGALDLETSERIARFQEGHGLPVTGLPDAATVDRIERESDRVAQARASSFDGAAPARDGATHGIAIQARLLQTVGGRTATTVGLVDDLARQSPARFAERMESVRGDVRRRVDDMISSRGPSYRATPTAERAELWRGVILSGDTRAGHELWTSLERTSPALAAEAAADLAHAARTLRSVPAVYANRPTDAHIDARVAEVIAGPPPTAAEVERAAALAGDPPPVRSDAAVERLALRTAYRAIQRARRQSGGNPGDRAVGAAAEALLPSVGGELFGQVGGGPGVSGPFDAVGRLIAVREGILAYQNSDGGQAAYDNAFAAEVRELAQTGAPPGATLGTTMSELGWRRTIDRALERFDAYQAWLDRHPEHPHSRAHSPRSSAVEVSR